jgi:serine/threonine-protein kinase RsbW
MLAWEEILSSNSFADHITVRFLEAHESEVLVDLISEAYGDSYDAEWVYQPDAIAERIERNTLRSAVGQLADGTILGHMALMKENNVDQVMHAGVAVVRDAARGHHLFERLKRFAAEWAAEAGYLGLFSEATAAHPYSQKANIALGAHETGFLLGWIPASVRNSAQTNAPTSSDQHRQSVALFYLKLNDGPTRPMFVPDQYQNITHNILTTSGLHGHIEIAGDTQQIAEFTEYLLEPKDDHNLTIIHVTEVGADLADVIEELRKQEIHGNTRDAVYLDLPLDQPATQTVFNEHHTEINFFFAGIFPNTHRKGDVLRLQSFANIDLHIADIELASDHGREILNFVLKDGELSSTVNTMDMIEPTMNRHQGT